MKRHGADPFNEHYADLFGDRWENLKRALLADPHHYALTTGLLQPYYLDPASVAVTHLLPLARAHAVLDMCSAPGGKALSLLSRLTDTAHLTCNERSATRRGRLKRVLERHVREEQRQRISVTGHDATRWGLYHPGEYDAIIADVPCSSERHLMHDPSSMAQWSTSRGKRISITQGAILAAGIDSLSREGHLLYITCALSPRENDHVVARVTKKRAGMVEVIPAAGREDLPPLERESELSSILARGEPTTHGLRILPDRTAGAGPLYVALLHRV